MTTITVFRPVPARAPRAAWLAAALFLRLLGAFQSGQRQRAEERAAADRVAEAAAVRDYAHRFAAHDPRFAADLVAAADRHERVQ